LIIKLNIFIVRRKKSQQTEMSFINQNFLKEQRKHREIDERNRITKGLQLLIQHLRNLKPETNTNIPRQLNLGLQSKQNQTKQNTTATIRAKYLETKGFYVPDNLKMLSRK
ncbi:MAG: hypothetical protein QXS90_03080, partial [Candidatus Diapherotrites archaeon]